jgi:hypothetical protein
MVAQYLQHERSIRISVRGGPPGAGKSRELFLDWENYNDSRKLYLSHSHSFLSEQAKRVKGLVRHLFGLKRICPCLRTKEYRNSIIAKLVRLNFSTKHVCSVCKELNAYPHAQKSCPYQQQFIHIKDSPVVVAPIEYVYTKVLDKYQPHYIAVDDCLTRISPHPPRRELSYALIHLSDLAGQPITSEHPIQELISRSDYNSFMKKLEKVYKNRVKQLAEEVKNKTKPRSYDKIFLIPPAGIDTYCKQAQLHGFRDRFATPALFPLFDYVFKNKTEDDEVQLKIIEAIPKMEFLNSLATRYQAEENVTVIFEHDGFEPKTVDRGSVVTRYVGKKGAWYPTTRSIKKSYDTRRNISKVIKHILEKDYKNNFNPKIGLVTPKDVTWKQFIPIGFDNIDCLTFGDLRGKNSLEDREILFVIGTYCVNKEDMEQDFSDWYARDPLTMEFKELKPHGDYYHYKDKDVEILRWMREDYEMYQAIHRIRPLLKKKQVYVFGVVPKEISRDGLKVIKIEGGYFVNKGERDWLINYVKQKGSVVERLVREDMTEEFGIKNDTAYKKIRNIVDKCDCLCFRENGGIKILVYVDE